MPRIIIVDDHPIVRDGLARLIAEKGGSEFEIVGMAGSVSEALSLMGTLSPDMVILDISLEGQDGTEFIKTIRAMEYDSRILVFSMYDEHLYAERVLEAGADGYVMKQEEPAEIFNATCVVAQGRVYLSNRIIAKLVRRKTLRSSEGFISAIDSLTDRELETFRLLGLGWRTRRIASELHLSMKTIETYCAHIKRKLGLEHFNELISHAVQWVNSRSGEESQDNSEGRSESVAPGGAE